MVEPRTDLACEIAHVRLFEQGEVVARHVDDLQVGADRTPLGRVDPAVYTLADRLLAEAGALPANDPALPQPDAGPDEIVAQLAATDGAGDQHQVGLPGVEVAARKGIEMPAVGIESSPDHP